MKYTKQPLSISGQIAKLQSRGLKVDNGLATECLSNISYYRLRAYTFPFQDNSNPEQDHEIVVPTTVGFGIDASWFIFSCPTTLFILLCRGKSVVK